MFPQRKNGMIPQTKNLIVVPSYFFTHHCGTDPFSGFFRSEGNPSFLANFIILLLVDRLLLYFSSKVWWRSEALTLLHGSGLTVNVPSSSLSSLLMRQGTRLSRTDSFSCSLIALVCTRAALRQFSFCKSKRRYRIMVQVYHGNLTRLIRFCRFCLTHLALYFPEFNRR